MCLSACSEWRLITPVAGNGRGMYTLVMSNSLLSIAMLMVSSSRCVSFFDVGDSGLQVLDVGTSRFCRELGLLNGRHVDVLCLEEDA